MQATAKGDNLRCKLEELAAVIFCRVSQVCELEVCEVMSLEDKLPQGPPLKLVDVPEQLDGEALKAQLFIDCMTKPVDHLVSYLSRRAREALLI